MSERIQIMRWHPRSPIATWTGERCLESAGTVLNFMVGLGEHGALEIIGPDDATKAEYALARKEAKRLWPEMLVLP